MSESLDLASTIGTWVGAGVGIIALIGIVGPAVIWYASTRDRQKTLNAIGRDNNNYLSPGYHLGPNIWLGQRIRAPMMKKADSVKPFDTLPAFDANKINPADTEATWVLFGSLLEAYGVSFKRGDNLVIRGGKALLAIHPRWILTIGLLGRYSNLKVRGTPTTRKISIHRRYSRRAARNEIEPPLIMPRVQHGSDYNASSKYVQFNSPLGDKPAALQPLGETILYGITGVFAFSATVPFPGEPLLQTVKFDLNTTQESHENHISPKDMFLMAMGFLKTSQSHYVSLMELSGMSEEMNDEDSASSLSGGRPRYRRYSDSIDVERVVVQERGTRVRREESMAKVYRLSNVELGQDIRQLGLAFLETDHIDTFSLVPVAPDRASSMLRDVSQWTKVPADADWIRVPGLESYEEIYLERIAAQKLAYGLLCLRWHPQRYLLDPGDRTGVGMKIFAAAADALPNFVFRLRDVIEWLNPSQADKRKLSSALGTVHTRLEAGASARLFTAAQDLDTILGELGSRGDQTYIGQIIGILAITNSEFRDLVYDSLRSLQETASSTISLDMPSATLKVPKAFGVMQHFYVDWQEMFPEEVRNHETLSVSYTQIVLATTQSLVKCEMLRCCPDSKPLIDTVMKLGDVVYMT